MEATNQYGQHVSPDFGGTTVVFFYVEDGTPGCETEAEQFALEADVYDEADVTVYGVSTDDIASHREFAEEHGIEFDLLADPDGDLADAFDVDRDHAGRTKRTTFVVRDGEIVRTDEDVTPDGHARDLLIELYDEGVVDLEF